MKIFGKELKINGFDIWHKGNLDPDEKVDKNTKITLPASTSGEASINIPHGVAPSTPINGDIWTTASALYARLNGTTRTIAHTASWSTVSQAEAETGTATTQRFWTAQRVRQAINAVLPTKLSQLENDIGAGAGLNIVASPTEPNINPGDWWYKEI